MAPFRVENESRQIGKVHMPETFHKRQRSRAGPQIKRTEDDREPFVDVRRCIR